MAALAGIGGGERYWVHIPATRPRAYKGGGLVAAAQAVKGSPMANEYGDSELIHVNKYELEKLREMWGEPGINPETGLPAYGLFGKILGTVAKIAGTVLLTPVLGPVGAAAAVSAASGVISGDDIGDILKNTALTAATAGAGQIGSKVLPGLTGVSEEVGRAIGAGLGTTAGAAVTGASLEDALLRGVQSGVGTYASNQLFDKIVDKNILGLGDAAEFLYNTGVDISNATGIDLGGATSDWFVPGATNVDANGNIIVTGETVGNTNLTTGSTTGSTKGGETKAGETKAGETKAGETKDDTIVVSGIGTDNVNLTTGSTVTTAGDTGAGADKGGDKGKDQTKDKDEIVVTGSGTDNVNLTNGSTTTTTTTGKDTGADKGKDQTKDKDEIVVTGSGTDNVNLTTGSTTTTTTGKDTGTDKGNVKDTNFYNTGTTTTTTDNTSPLVPRGGTYDINPNRADIFGTRGIANIGFDPFTYGQATGDQPGEFLFFTQGGKPAGIVGSYTGPTSAIGGAAGTTTTTTGGTTGGAGGGTGGGTTGGTPPGGTPGGTTQTRPAGFTGVMSNQKIGDTQVVDGKTYVWGGDSKGWQFLATDNNGNQVLMPTGATNITSIADAFKSGVYRPANEAETKRLAEIDRIMEATEAAPTAAAARAINPAGVYFDIDAATAAAIGRPELVGTQMSMRDLQQAKLDAEAAQREAIAAQIPTQVKAAQAAPAQGMTARSYYMDYVTPLASSYYNTGKLDAAKARALQQAVEPFVGANDLAGAQNAVNTYLSSAGLVAPAMADGGEVDGDDMAAHLIAYQKGGGHQGPGRVKGIGSGQEDKIPAWLSDGEYVWSAQDVADLGDGSTDEGVRRLDKMRQMVRRRAGRKDVKNIAKPQQGIDTMLKAVGGSV